MSNFYFSSDGSLKFTGGSSALSTIQNAMYTPSTSSSSSSTFSDAMKTAALEASGFYTNNGSSSNSVSSLSKEMKQAAMTNSQGTMSSNQKKAILANNASFQAAQAMRIRLNEIMSRKPRTFDDDEDFVLNTSALKGFTTARENLFKYSGS